MVMVMVMVIRMLQASILELPIACYTNSPSSWMSGCTSAALLLDSLLAALLILLSRACFLPFKYILQAMQ